MKKLITIFLAVILVMSFAACNQNTDVEPTGNSTTATMSETNVTEDTNAPTSTTDGTEVTTTTEATDPTQNTEEGTSPTNRDDNGETNPTVEAGSDHVTVPTNPIHVHEYVSKTTAATCTNDGYTTHTCDCGDSYVDTKVTASGHNFSEWKTTKEPTTTKTGTAERKCSKCGAKETKTLGKLAENHTHSYTESITEQPTCAKLGLKTFTCSCGDKYTKDIAKVSHNYKSSMVSATCVNGGYTSYKCSMCGDSYTDSHINATGHTYTDSVVAPTCTAGGYTKHTCSKCGNSYTDSKVAATGHNYTVTANTTTCTAGGTKTETCDKCGETKTSVSNATGHAEATETKESTCYSQGYTKVYCSVCGTVISETTALLADCSMKTARLSDAATLRRKIWMEGGSYTRHTDWVVEACETCGYFDEDDIRFAYTDYEAAVIMLGYVNDLRKSVYGTDKYNLTLDAGLMALAKTRAEEISRPGNYNHSGAQSQENISSEPIMSVYGHFVEWLNSPGHYEQMLDTDYATFGYGFYAPTPMSTAYGVQCFGYSDAYNGN